MIQEILDFGGMLGNIVSFGIVLTVWEYIKNYRPVNVTLSCGSFIIRRKDFTVQNVTNIVSCKFYDGDIVPPEIRKEIIDVTCPKIKTLIKKEE